MRSSANIIGYITVYTVHAGTHEFVMFLWIIMDVLVGATYMAYSYKPFRHVKPKHI